MLLRCPRRSPVSSRIRQAQKAVLVRLISTETPRPLQDLVDPLDVHISNSIRRLLKQRSVPVSTLYEQYRARSGRIRDDLILVSEERPTADRRVTLENHDCSLAGDTELQGDGTLLIVHALLKSDHGPGSGNDSPEDEPYPDEIIEKLAICSGFALNTRATSGTAEPAIDNMNDGAVVLTCAHTLEEVGSSVELARDDSIETAFPFRCIDTSHVHLASHLYPYLSSLPLQAFLSRSIKSSQAFLVQIYAFSKRSPQRSL